VILILFLGCGPGSPGSADTPYGSEPATESGLVTIDVKYFDATYECWCETTEDRPADVWGPFSGPTTSEDGCNDNVWPTWATVDGRCISILQECGDAPSADPWLRPCADLAGCCELADDHGVYPCESLGFNCSDAGWVEAPP
jgi:hypothetical protein